RAEFGRGNYGNAIEYLEKELSQKPASVAALNGLGACYDQLGRYEVAQRYYFRALDLSPESSQTLSNIGYSYLQQGRHREAVAVLELALQKNDGNQVAANNLELAKSGLVSNASPTQVARSSNNGSQIDQTDFVTLLRLLQGAGGAAGSTLAGSADLPGGDAPAVAAQVQSINEPVVTVSVGGAVSSTIIRQQESFEVESDDEALAETAVAALEPDAPTTADPTTLSPAPESETAGLALVTEQAAVVVPTLEPVSGDDIVAEESNEAQQDYPQLTLTIIDSPQLDPARVSDAPMTIANLSQPLNLVIENGNGVRGIARATSNLLAGDKLDVKRVSDADHFDYAETVIYYRPELYPYAQEIAASLNLSCELLPSDQLAEGADVQVVLGHDFASQVSVQNGGLSFEANPNSEYLASTLRLEIANGNGVNGMAARVREFLRDKGSNVVRISDADNYDYQQSLLYYRRGTRIAAEDLANRLPLTEIRLIETNSLRRETDARLVIGRDYLPYDKLVMN
ncbi:MAG: LytR C-terminal domain-containing protein, partial [Gammaproteobacteria bacterium]|nr:LytR C-terminal domain-containing protein [Gammaproteobacteria bacterium]